MSRDSLGLVNERLYVQSALPSTLKKGPKTLKILISWIKKSQGVLTEYRASRRDHTSSAAALGVASVGSSGRRAPPHWEAHAGTLLLYWEVPSNWGRLTEVATRVRVKH